MDRWTVRRLLSWTREYLEKRGIESPRLEAEHLIAHVLGIERMDLYLDPERPLTYGELQHFKELLKRRAKGEPLQYITWIQGFWKYTFRVRPGVLIPRAESEVLVKHALKVIKNEVAPLILDVGVGSGCLILSILADAPQARGIGTDLSAVALDITKENALRLGISERLSLVRGDLLSPFKKGVFDVIISNPPYVSNEEWATLPREVKNHEPKVALDGGKEGLYYVSKLISRAWEHLKPGGFLLIEIGWEQGEKAKTLCKGRPYRDITIAKDLSKRDRALMARRV